MHYSSSERTNGSEVRVRRDVSGWFAGVAGLGFVLGLGIAASAQTTAHTPAPATAPATAPAGGSETSPCRAIGTAFERQRTEDRVEAGLSRRQPRDEPAGRADSADGTGAGGDARAADGAGPLHGDACVWRRATSRDTNGSAYIPVDSWVYPAMLRLYSLGYVDTAYLAMRPYTRRSALHMLQASEGAIAAGGDVQAQEILAALLTELTDEGVPGKTERGTVYGVQSVYTRMMGISGPILVDSYHVGQTFFNDYGRPHETGFNNVTGFSTLNEQGPWSLYVRGEYQHAPSAAGYSQALAQQVSLMDEIVFAPPNDPQATVPAGPIAATNPFRLVEATLSVHILGHEISGGKSDAWLGPGMGSAMPWSNNAENIYSFRINRVEPINIKYLSRWLGPVRYDFFYGSLKGHTDPTTTGSTRTCSASSRRRTSSSASSGR